MKISRPMPVLAFLIAGTLIAQDAKVTPLMSKDLVECPEHRQGSRNLH